jgi:hypothetical protein
MMVNDGKRLLKCNQTCVGALAIDAFSAILSNPAVAGIHRCWCSFCISGASMPVAGIPSATGVSAVAGIPAVAGIAAV